MGQAPAQPGESRPAPLKPSSKRGGTVFTALREWLTRLTSWHRSRTSGDTGLLGEGLAARHLSGLGYEVLARNFRVRGGEADLIVAKDGWIVVVEVKTRRSLRFGSPVEAVRGEKGRRVLRAGRIYCRRNGLSLGKLRGDVVAVEWPEGGGDPHIRHWVGGLSDSRAGR